MRFAFTDDQLVLARSTAGFLAAECPPATVRAIRDDPAAGGAVWRGLAELGVVGMTVPEAHGGLGMDLVTLARVLEEGGYAALPLPLIEVTAVAVPALVTTGDREWLRRVAAGDAIVATGADAWPRVDHVVEPDAEAADRAALGAAAVLVGAGRRLVDLATAYATQREQFGRPIGAFQAVKHHLATAFVEVEFAKPVVYRAAWSLAHGAPDASRDASAAKVAGGEAALLAARTALQVHGAIGYTAEHDLHLWMELAWRLAAAHGTTDEHRARVAAAVLDA